jgi:endonuclease YncB( thermonuclease family)
MSRAVPPPGWYPDNQNPFLLRYWNGNAWTEHTRMPAQRAPVSRTGSGFSRGVLAGVLAGAGAIAAVVLLVVAALAIGTDAADPPTGKTGKPTRVEPRKPKPVPEKSPAKQERPDRKRQSDGTKADTDERQQSGSRPAPRPEPAPAPRPRTYLVTRVVDGDTLELGNGETVRLVGIDTPEVGECGYDRASVALGRLVTGRQVRLSESDEDRDRYGRLLRYVDVGGVDAGLRQIRSGLAIARYDSRDGYGFHPREPRYIAADNATRNLSCPKPIPGPQPLVGGGGACAPGYSPCVPPYPPDVDCADVNGPITVTGSDPHGLDGDGDGVACE